MWEGLLWTGGGGRTTMQDNYVRVRGPDKDNWALRAVMGELYLTRGPTVNIRLTGPYTPPVTCSSFFYYIFKLKF